MIELRALGTLVPAGPRRRGPPSGPRAAEASRAPRLPRHCGPAAFHAASPRVGISHFGVTLAVPRRGLPTHVHSAAGEPLASALPAPRSTRYAARDQMIAGLGT